MKRNFLGGAWRFLHSTPRDTNVLAIAAIVIWVVKVLILLEVRDKMGWVDLSVFADPLARHVVLCRNLDAWHKSHSFTHRR